MLIALQRRSHRLVRGLIDACCIALCNALADFRVLQTVHHCSDSRQARHHEAVSLRLRGAIRDLALSASILAVTGSAESPPPHLHTRIHPPTT